MKMNSYSKILVIFAVLMLKGTVSLADQPSMHVVCKVHYKGLELASLQTSSAVLTLNKKQFVYVEYIKPFEPLSYEFELYNETLRITFDEQQESTNELKEFSDLTLKNVKLIIGQKFELTVGTTAHDSHKLFCEVIGEQ
jgi:hypothetical protein